MEINMRNISYWIIATILGGGLAIIQRLPQKHAGNILAKMARAAAPILPRSQMARENMKRAFPKKSKQEIETMIKDMWEHIARNVVEYAFLDAIANSQNKIEIEHNEMFEKIKKRKKGAIFFTAHIGNWEIIPMVGAKYGLDIAALFRMPNNPYFAKKLLKARGTIGRLVPAGLGAAHVLTNVLQKNGMVGLLVDQAFNRGHTIKFLDRDASANPLIVKLAEKTGCDIYPIRCIRKKNGKFKVEVLKNIKIKKKGKKIDVQGTLEEIHAIVEKWVREYPEQWLWLHNRWKSRGT